MKKIKNQHIKLRKQHKKKKRNFISTKLQHRKEKQAFHSFMNRINNWCG